jgi:methylthioribose-1-phosphate isomerase
MIRTIEWTDEGVLMIDQRLLPSRERYNTYRSVEGVADAIRNMVIRGAPAIGVAAAMGIALGVKNLSSKDNLEVEFEKICQIVQETRPTARNLFWAIERMRAVFQESQALSMAELQRALREEALRIQREDIEINRKLGQFGQALLEDGATVLTHCNAGALATAGYGTALGVIRAAVENGKSVHIYADETRPFLQGARLTSWEMVKERIPCTLITDNMSGFLMKAGRIDLVVVGADRIARNGDVANKIGTYMVAVLAKEHGIPFYVAAPLSTIDLNTPTGDDIPIEQRNPIEVSEISGHSLAPASIEIENPAFDVTPNRLVSAIITEQGLARFPYEESLAGLFTQDKSST